MHLAFWQQMWQLHEQAKDLFRFFVNPNESNMGKDGQGNVLGGGNNIGPPSYKKTQLIGLFLGPFLFFFNIIIFPTCWFISRGYCYFSEYHLDCIMVDNRSGSNSRYILITVSFISADRRT